ncbi:MAG: glycosyltransferase family 39 protein [Armatimonadota bacterium]|jgi:mannosyltransferase
MTPGRATGVGTARSGRLVLVLLLAATLLAAGLRTYSLADDNLWRDEGASLLLSGGATPQEVIRQTAVRDPHPPGYYLALHFWRRAFGSSDAALRAMSVLLGTLAVPAIFLLGRILFGTRVALGAAALMAVMPTSLRFSQEARSYAMLSLLMILAWYFAVRITRGRDRPATLGFALTAVLLPYTHYWGGPILLAVVVIPVMLLWGDRERRRHLWQLLPGVTLTALMLLPWLGIIVRHQMDAASLGEGTVFFGVKPSSFIGAFGRPFGYDLLFGPMGALAVLTGIGCAALVPWLWRQDTPDAPGPCTPGAAWWCVGMLVVPIVVIAAIGQVTTFWIGVRVPNITMVPTAIICGAVVVGLWRRGRAASVALSLVLVVLCAHGAWCWYTAPKRPDWEGIAAVVEAGERPGDVVVTIDSNFIPGIFDHYYSGSLPVLGFSRWIMERDEIVRRARELWPEGGRMWLIVVNPHDSPAVGILRELASDEEHWRIRDRSFYRLGHPSEGRWEAVAAGRGGT